MLIELTTLFQIDVSSNIGSYLLFSSSAFLRISFNNEFPIRLFIFWFYTY